MTENKSRRKEIKWIEQKKNNEADGLKEVLYKNNVVSDMWRLHCIPHSELWHRKH